MSQSTEARNKAIVLEAFDTVFNKRDSEMNEGVTAIRFGVVGSIRGGLYA